MCSVDASSVIECGAQLLFCINTACKRLTAFLLITSHCIRSSKHCACSPACAWPFSFCKSNCLLLMGFHVAHSL
jgi:hypothetical protein